MSFGTISSNVPDSTACSVLPVLFERNDEVEDEVELDLFPARVPDVSQMVQEFGADARVFFHLVQHEEEVVGLHQILA
jgi:hypothetical protein